MMKIAGNRLSRKRGNGNNVLMTGALDMKISG
jgi:hypothetical protein